MGLSTQQQQTPTTMFCSSVNLAALGSIIVSMMMVSTSAVHVEAQMDYFALKSATGGCIGRKMDGSGDKLFPKACTRGDDTIYWRIDDMYRIHSKVDDSECIQVRQQPEIADGVEGISNKDLRVYVKECASLGLKSHFQWFDPSWAMEGSMSGALYLLMRNDLCMVHYSADNSVLGESHIMMLDCDEAGRLVGKPCTWTTSHLILHQEVALHAKLMAPATTFSSKHVLPMTKGVRVYVFSNPSESNAANWIKVSAQVNLNLPSSYGKP